MKTLSLTQPWASLVSAAYKLVETRSWGTPYRGILAIHAAKTFPVDARLTAGMDRFSTPLKEAGFHLYWNRKDARGLAPLEHDLPLGAVIALCTLNRCVRVELIRDQLSAQERSFGNYEDGRWAWILSDVDALPEPIPARGALGLWEWQREVAHG